MFAEAFFKGVALALGVLGFSFVMMGVLIVIVFIAMVFTGKIRFEDYSGEDGGTEAIREGRTEVQKRLREKRVKR